MIFSSIDVHLGVIREPCLHYEKHPPKLLIMFAFGLTETDFQFLCFMVGLTVMVLQSSIAEKATSLRYRIRRN